MKTAIVTGASRGVGYATSKFLSENGYHVIAVSRNLEAMMPLKSENVELYQLDITDFKKMEEFADKYKEITLDLLVNNAGGGSGSNYIENDSPENWKKSYDVNVVSPMYLSKLMLPCLKKSQSPTVIFITSLAGKYPYVSGGNYATAKRGESGLVDVMRLEFSQQNIKITEICPGTIDTCEEHKPAALDALDLAETIKWVASLPCHMNINHVELNHIHSRKY